MKKTILFLVLCLLLVLSSGIIQAEDNSLSIKQVSPRALGMGGTFTGLADDVSAVLYNPAGIGQNSVLDVFAGGGIKVSNYTELAKLENVFNDLQDSNLDAEEMDNLVEQLENIEQFGTTAQMFSGLNMGNFAGGINYDNSLSIYGNQEIADIVAENMETTEGIVGFGQEIITPMMDIGAVAYGVNVKLMQSKYQEYQLTADQNNQQRVDITAEGLGYGMDAGVMVKATELIQVGLMVDNLFAPEYELTGEKVVKNYENGDWVEDSSAGDPDYNKLINPDRSVRAGASVYVPVIAATLSADLDNIYTTGEEKRITHLGIEKNILFNALSLRGGTFVGEDINDYYTAGLGINFLPLNIDTGLAVDKNLSQDAVFSLSANMKF